MKKQTIMVIVAIIAVIAIIIGVVAINSNKTKKDGDAIKIENAKDMEAMLNTIYSKLEDQLPSLEIMKIDTSDESQVITYTGVTEPNNIDKLVVSEPMMSSQAYSAMVIKVKDGADIEKMKQEILDNADMNKWICVSAEKLYVTNYGNIIFSVMSDDEWATSVYNEFKNIINNQNGKELERTGDNEDIDIPPERVVQ